MSTQDQYPYDEDEFDIAGDRTPHGVHRTPLPWWRKALPFLVVLILAPLLAFVVVQFISREQQQEPDPVATESASPTGTETSPEESTEPTGEPSKEPSQEPSAELDQNLNVWVLNGTGISGFAGERADILIGAGWTNVVADDYQLGEPDNTTIYYRDESMADEAAAIADKLGISEVIEDSDAAPEGIYVVLRPDAAN